MEEFITKEIFLLITHHHPVSLIHNTNNLNHNHNTLHKISHNNQMSNHNPYLNNNTNHLPMTTTIIHNLNTKDHPTIEPSKTCVGPLLPISVKRSWLPPYKLTTLN